MNYADPTGHFWSELGDAIGSIVGAIGDAFGAVFGGGNDDKNKNTDEGKHESDIENLKDIYNNDFGCPPTPPENDPNWKPYVGFEEFFHCGYKGYLENKKPTPNDPAKECFYDGNRLVDNNHEYRDCQGTADDYPASDLINHTFRDRGGPSRYGVSSFLESRRKELDVMQEKAEQINQKIADEIAKELEEVYGDSF